MSQLETKRVDRFHTFGGVSFCGIPAAQYYADFYVWEGILNDLPDLEAIVEIGTFKGGFARYLAAQASGRGLLFRTYDTIEPEKKIPGFIQMDVFAHAEEIGEWLHDQEPLILLCDGGNKARELRTFSAYLGPSSVMAVHDWETEMDPKEVPGWLEMVYEEFCVELGSVTRFFRQANG